MIATVELVRQLCECTGYSCSKSVMVPLNDEPSKKLKLIVDGCVYGPDVGDVLVEERLFREAPEMKDGAGQGG